MHWIWITILAYLFLGIASLGDKYLLTGKVKSPRSYVFYIGVSGLLVLLLIPFVGFVVPKAPLLLLSLLAGFFFTAGLFWYIDAIQTFEASRVIPAVSATMPIFSFLFVLIFAREGSFLDVWGFLAFCYLILGGILVTYEKSKKLTAKSLGMSIITAFFFAAYLTLAKYVYDKQSFWHGLILIRLGVFFSVAAFPFIFKEVKEELLSTKTAEKKKSLKSTALFLINQGVGALGTIFQNWAISISPLVFVPIVIAMSGLQYVFIFSLAVFFSIFYPKLIKEDISRGVMLQKIAAILLISAGLIILAF